MPLLSIQNLSLEFPGSYETDYAVEDVSFELAAGEIPGLVGEFGAGKSTIGNGIVQLSSPPGKVSKGEINLNGNKISDYPDPEVRIKQFPHQFPGGMRKRVLIAIALAGDPEMLSPMPAQLTANRRL